MSNWQRLQQRLGSSKGSSNAPRVGHGPAAPVHHQADGDAVSLLLDMRNGLATDVVVAMESEAVVDSAQRARPGREARRLQSVRALAACFEQSAASALGGRKWFSHFEAWLWAARAEGVGLTALGVVPVLPSAVTVGGAACSELHRKLVRAGQTTGGAEAICSALVQRAQALAEEDRREESAGSASTRESEDGKVTVAAAPAPAGSADAVTVRVLSCGGVEVRCTDCHLDKLSALHAAALRAARRTDDRKRKRGESAPSEPASSSTRQPPQPAAAGEVAAASFCVLARLLSLQGGDHRAGGMQAACPPALFDALRRELGVTAELFASPLNARFPTFCSAAADVDAAFGSAGSFFAVQPRQGAFLANPPFAPELVLAMAERMAAALAAADQAKRCLTFVVVIPHWPDKSCWRRLNELSWLRRSALVPQAEHGYVEGGQHYRLAGSYRANHDSSVFFLQSTAAAAARPATARVEKALRHAWKATGTTSKYG